MTAQAEEGKKDFRLREALAYLANMRTFWMITVGLGEPSHALMFSVPDLGKWY